MNKESTEMCPFDIFNDSRVQYFYTLNNAQVLKMSFHEGKKKKLKKSAVFYLEHTPTGLQHEHELHAETQVL